jgi:hypothetical protein
MSLGTKAESIYSPMIQPQIHCDVCASRTPHRNERWGIEGRIVIKRICLACNNEEPKPGA